MTTQISFRTWFDIQRENTNNFSAVVKLNFKLISQCFMCYHVPTKAFYTTWNNQGFNDEVILNDSDPWKVF